MPNTSAPVSGTLKSGVNPDRTNENYPDPEQERREQAREETRKARGLRSTHPEYTYSTPDPTDFQQDLTVSGSNKTREESELAGES